MTDAHIAKVQGRGLPISKKFAVEVCDFIRYKPLSKANALLTEVLEMKRAVPFRRYKKDQSHKPSVGPGRYPLKTSYYFIKLLHSLEKNAEQKGLNSEALVVSVAMANKGNTRMRQGRHRGQMKNTHVLLCAEERAEKKEKAKK